jgi:outer membrane protein OmpA-like peptidoglycan-associated protein
MRLLLGLICAPILYLSQTQKLDTVFCDCLMARSVKLKTASSVGPTIAPLNAGESNEISQPKQKTPFSFDKEHHSAWYKLLIASDGNLVFDVVPVSNKDDYDFVLFKAGKTNFCDSLKTNPIKPIRACISRNKKELQGITGMRFNHSKELINEGVGDAFVKPLPVKVGDVYYLVLDNVYKNGAGHSIKFSFEEQFIMKGEVKNEEGMPLIADVTITNLKGDTVEKTQSNKEGNFSLDMILKKDVNYNINIFADNSFFYSQPFSTKTKDSLKNLKAILPKLKKGDKYTVGNINFEADSDRHLKTATPAITNLYKLLKLNPDLEILVVGHTNGCDSKINYSQKLSERRALAITNILIAERLSSSGKGCSEMLFSEKGPEWQQSLNRRVEIMVLKD